MAPNFYERVWEVVREVPRGRVVTYGQVAVVLGAPAAARAVGYALRALPHDTDAPWWRVINAKGGISLRGRGYGADLQRELLEGEGVVFDAADTVDLRVYRWWPDEESDGPRPA
ncbi:MAG: methylated-DNA--[protein]-cysteine S-methyltransferase [Chloroflexi bacterium]|nr:methylated-DNA--[protein]-cysteine S-methyltransferase [Chloroflexota bacterium]